MLTQFYVDSLCALLRECQHGSLRRGATSERASARAIERESMHTRAESGECDATKKQLAKEGDLE